MKGSGQKPFLVRMLIGATLLTGCATQPIPPPDTDADLGGAVVQPLRDLSLIRETMPEVLQRAAVGPYDLIQARDRPSLGVELSALDEALGRRGFLKGRGGLMACLAPAT